VAATAAAGHRPVMLLLVGVPGSGGWTWGATACSSIRSSIQQDSRRFGMGSA
jgi:hypothetical protein